ncbi:uncharacterized protein LOC131947266 isoform X2 [Physella acuta]|uniref:uncharacterized protein LOC131947266 isoform X2 n=1 Tax=Physella acuta TaxID=109671 RepID=UPI0027DBFF26|nr:uncharacterized protein LOC131947266 isoform X2 [Physella acuta]
MSSTEGFLKIVPNPEELYISNRRNQSSVKCTENGCGYIAGNHSLLGVHRAKTHKYKIVPDGLIHHFHCPVSDCIYNSQSQRYCKSLEILRTHYMKMHSEKKFSCKKCGKSFGLERDCQRHEKECGDTFTCPDCEKTYTNRSALIRHCDCNGHRKPNSLTRIKPVKEHGTKKLSAKDEIPCVPDKKSPVFILPKPQAVTPSALKQNSLEIQTDTLGAQIFISKMSSESSVSQAVQTVQQLTRSAGIQTHWHHNLDPTSKVRRRQSIALQTVKMGGTSAQTQTGEALLQQAMSLANIPIVKVCKATQKSRPAKRKHKSTDINSTQSQTLVSAHLVKRKRSPHSADYCSVASSHDKAMVTVMDFILDDFMATMSTQTNLSCVSHSPFTATAVPQLQDCHTQTHYPDQLSQLQDCHTQTHYPDQLSQLQDCHTQTHYPDQLSQLQDCHTQTHYPDQLSQLQDCHTQTHYPDRLLFQVPEFSSITCDQNIQTTDVYCDHLPIQLSPTQTNSLSTNHTQTNSINSNHTQTNSISSNHTQTNSISSNHTHTNSISSNHTHTNSISTNHTQTNSISSNHTQTQVSWVGVMTDMQDQSTTCEDLSSGQLPLSSTFDLSTMSTPQLSDCHASLDTGNLPACGVDAGKLPADVGKSLEDPDQALTDLLMEVLTQTDEPALSLNMDKPKACHISSSCMETQTFESLAMDSMTQTIEDFVWDIGTQTVEDIVTDMMTQTGDELLEYLTSDTQTQTLNEFCDQLLAGDPVLNMQGTQTASCVESAQADHASTQTSSFFNARCSNSSSSSEEDSFSPWGKVHSSYCGITGSEKILFLGDGTSQTCPDFLKETESSETQTAFDPLFSYLDCTDLPGCSVKTARSLESSHTQTAFDPMLSTMLSEDSKPSLTQTQTATETAQCQTPWDDYLTMVESSETQTNTDLFGSDFPLSLDMGPQLGKDWPLLDLNCTDSYTQTNLDQNTQT